MNIMPAFIAMRIALITRQSDGKKRTTKTRRSFAVIALVKCVSLNTQYAIINARIAGAHLTRNACHMIIIILNSPREIGITLYTSPIILASDIFHQ